MEGKIFDYFRANWSRVRGLGAGLLFIAFLAKSFDEFTSIFLQNEWYRLLVYAACASAFLFVWMVNRYHLPRVPKNKIGIVVCIETENSSQKHKLQEDFTERIREQLRGHGLQESAVVLHLNNFRAERLVGVLNRYRGVLAAVATQKILRIPRELRAWRSVSRRVRGHLYIWGRIKERNDGTEKYFLTLDTLVVHRQLSGRLKKNIQDNVNNAWNREFQIEKKFDLKEFEATADSTYFATQYIIGLAALVSGFPDDSLRLHENLADKILASGKVPKNLQFILVKLPNLIFEAYYLKALFAYFSNNFQESKKLVNHSLVLSPKHYSALLTRSVIECVHDRNPMKALETVRFARTYSGSDGGWRYNEAFLLAVMKRYDEALEIYRKISRSSFAYEDQLLDSVLPFLERWSFLAEDGVADFIIGYLLLEKRGNVPAAYRSFESFLEKSKGNILLDIWIKKAREYKEQLEKTMDIP